MFKKPLMPQRPFIRLQRVGILVFLLNISHYSVFSSAVRAIAGYVQTMVDNLKIVLFTQSLFYFFQFFFNKFDYLSALDASEVAVMPMPVDMLIVHMSVLIPDLPY